MMWHLPHRFGVFLLCLVSWTVDADQLSLAATGHERGSERPTTIVTLGTSLTYEHSWQGHLAERLRYCWNRPINVIRIARGGATSRWGLTQIQEVLKHQPSIVTIEFVMNDANLRHLMSMTESLSNHAQIVGRIRENLPGAMIYLMTMNPALGFRSWLFRPRMQAYDEQYRQFAAEKQLGLIDIALKWRPPSKEELWSAIPDGVHPRFEAVLDVVVPEIARALTQDHCRTGLEEPLRRNDWERSR
jgi:lysophospholipase L1-like esterase